MEYSLCYYAIFLSCTNSKEVYVPRRYYYLTFFADLFSVFKVKSWVLWQANTLTGRINKTDKFIKQKKRTKAKGSNL